MCAQRFPQKIYHDGASGFTHPTTQIHTQHVTRCPPLQFEALQQYLLRMRCEWGSFCMDNLDWAISIVRPYLEAPAASEDETEGLTVGMSSSGAVGADEHGNARDFHARKPSFIQRTKTSILDGLLGTREGLATFVLPPVCVRLSE